MGMEVVEPSRGRKFQESCGEPKVKFPKPKSLDGEASIGSPKLKSCDGEVTVKSPNFDNFDGEAMVMSPKWKNLEEEAMVKPPEPKNRKRKQWSSVIRAKNLEGEAMFMSSEPKNLEGEAMVVSSEPKNLKGGAMVKSLKPKNLDRKDTVKLPKPMIFDGEASPKSPNLKNSYGEVMAKTPKLKNLDREARVKSPKPKSPKVKNLEGEIMIKSSKFKNLDGDAKVKSPRSNSLDAEKIPVAKLQIVTEGGIRGSSAETKEKTSNCKQIKEKEGEISNKAQVGSPSSSSLSQNDMEENHEKKILMRSTSENKMEGSDVKLVLQNHRVQQESGDFRLSSGNTGVDLGGRNLTGKHVGKLSVKSPKNGIRLKRKFAEEVDDKSLVSQDEESVEAYGDRLVVQALMSAENCPWRKGRKSTGSRSATPKFKTKDKQKLLNGTLPSRGLSIFQHNNEMDMEDEEDLVPQDDENEKALVLYKQPQEFSITLPPCVPPKANHDGASSEGASARAMVKRTLRLFQWITRKFLQEEEARSRDYGKAQRADLKAASILKESNNWVNYGTPTLGDVPGVEVGDEFHYRVELSIIGVHRPFQGGIDYMKRSDGVIVATSIVASGGYAEDNTDSSDILIYSGSGGTAVRKDKQVGDQKLERGNLALTNSVDSQTPVRVVRGFKEQFKGSDSRGTKMVSTFTYDGLYIVEKYWQEKGPHGFSVFKFQLREDARTT
ncbi:histone-lysine N-methyltransferase, H3 lysine-9 specific SUVH6-like [Iris pallida]|uniref:Histone-lysine N-methyltransferase, H3 lysine-9 specific SUVH6-like n=1 Tax=Iris pallida TaxID=29817 RepID=A0AAX6HU68_IRIPA|nr:histone-lysine N-methyltransferase, H3 lysine-9 specific SUVH6-like [Iris pallida]